MSERTTERTGGADDRGSDSRRDDETGVDEGVLDGEIGPDESLDGGPRSGDVGWDLDGTTVAERTGDTAADASLTDRVSGRASDLFSPVSFLLQLGGALAGAFVVGDLIPLLPLAGFVGIFLVAGLAGTLSGEARYPEAALAGGTAGALALVAGSLTLSVVTGGLLPLLGAAVGALAGLGGFYAGRDLRDGLTRDL